MVHDLINSVGLDVSGGKSSEVSRGLGRPDLCLVQPARHISTVFLIRLFPLSSSLSSLTFFASTSSYLGNRRWCIHIPPLYIMGMRMTRKGTIGTATAMITNLGRVQEEQGTRRREELGGGHSEDVLDGAGQSWELYYFLGA